MADAVRRGGDEAHGRERVLRTGDDDGLAVDEGAVAVEDDELGHERLLFAVKA
jgi:hypothetical protein